MGTTKLFFLLLLALCFSLGQSQMKVLNLKDYGAIEGGNVDISQAFLKAWDDACKWKGGPTRIEISEGVIYLMNSITVKGPCAGPIGILNSGILRAPPGLRGDHWIKFQYIDRLGIYGLGHFDGQVSPRHPEPNLPVLLKFAYVTNSLVEKVLLTNSQSTHLQLFGCNEITILKIRIFSPGDSPNTDGIEIGTSTGIRITDSNIAAGDDCIAIIRGSKNINITGVVCGPSHGISIGSIGTTPNEQVEQVLVQNCRVFNSMNGLRIKTWANNNPGLVSNILYQNVFLGNVDNPIIIDQNYCPPKTCPKGNSRVQIKDVKFRYINGTSTIPNALNLQCSGSNPCDGIELNNIDIKHVDGHTQTISTCANVRGHALGVEIPKSCIP